MEKVAVIATLVAGAALGSVATYVVIRRKHPMIANSSDKDHRA